MCDDELECSPREKAGVVTENRSLVPAEMYAELLRSLDGHSQASNVDGVTMRHMNGSTVFFPTLAIHTFFMSTTPSHHVAGAAGLCPITAARGSITAALLIPKGPLLRRTMLRIDDP